MDTMPTHLSRTPFKTAALALALLIPLGCDSTEPTTFTPGPLGAVQLGPGDPIQFRALLSTSGAPGLALPIRRGMDLAVEDLDSVRGRAIRLGATVDEGCSTDVGERGARTITADKQVVGIVGTVCSGAAVGAAPVVSEAGFLMISPANTSPQLTSNLEGAPQPHRHEGYYRISNNGIHNGIAGSEFAYRELELRRVVTVDDGDAYTTGVARAFKDAFEELGGTVPATLTVDKDPDDMTATLAEIVAGEADGVFFPLFLDAGSALTQAVRASESMDDLTLISDAALLVAGFLAMPQSEGVYFVGPQSDFGDNRNPVTGQTASSVLNRFVAAHGNHPGSQYWAHAYDAVTLLARAVETVAEDIDGTLYIDRAELRKTLTDTNTSGLIGDIECDDFGDCGTGRLDIVHHTDHNVTDIARLAVVYRYTPASPASAPIPARRGR